MPRLIINWLAELLERLAVSFLCWAMGWQRNAVQRADADWLLCVGVAR
jgi:hypothetical protein